MAFRAISIDGVDETYQLDTLESLHAYVKPKPEELKWRQIPWNTDLWAARRQALAENRPIFMWAMNGHPLGCV